MPRDPDKADPVKPVHAERLRWLVERELHRHDLEACRVEQAGSPVGTPLTAKALLEGSVVSAPGLHSDHIGQKVAEGEPCGPPSGRHYSLATAMRGRS